MTYVEGRSRRRVLVGRRRLSRAISAGVALASIVAAVGIASGVAVAAQEGWAEIARLRAFAPGVSARLEAGPGRRVRLAASTLPRPDVLTTDARAFVAWASAPGRVVRLGALRRETDGRAAFEFSHPPGLARYTLIVTAELSADAARPAGAPVLSTRALEVNPREIASAARRTASAAGRAAAGAPAAAAAATPERMMSAPRDGVPATRARVASGARRAGAATVRAAAADEPAAATGSRICVGRGCGADDFSAEVNGALRGGGGDGARGRSLSLVGGRGARRARGWARVASRGGTAYARVRFRRVPHPARYGARRHVLWAVTDEVGPVYVGSLPVARLNRAPAYVRAENVNDPKFRLLVTAEKTYPAPRPAGRRVLLTYKGRRRRTVTSNK